MMRSDSGKGNGRRRTPLIRLKMAVFAPMPSASVTMATKVKPGVLRSWRKANFKSFMSFVSQRNHRIDSHRATRRKPGGDQGRATEKDCNDGVNRKVGWADTIEQARHQTRDGKSSQEPGEQTDSNNRKALPKNHRQHVDLLSAE